MTYIVNVILAFVVIYLYWQLKIDLETIRVMKYYLKVIRDDERITLGDAKGIASMVLSREFKEHD